MTAATITRPTAGSAHAVARTTTTGPVAARPPVRRSNRPAAAVYRRRRIVAAALVVGVLGVARQAGAALGGTTLATPERHPQVITYIVEPGDTLWGIAETIAPDHDPREVVDELRDSRDSDVLVPGETILWAP